ncbi:MAG: hypothetical protein QM536_07205 [Chitinophagaceae bacterium]|nr:hypothetical protein [Chitinophagaceae bacterium]
MKKHMYAFLCILTFFGSKAQDTGEIKDATIIIEKNKNIQLPASTRNFEKIPSNNSTPSEIQIPFHLTTIQPFVRPMEFELKALKLQTTPLEKYYGNILKIGFGNYYSPLLDAYFYNKRNKQYSYGANIQHISFGTGPIDGKNSSEGNTKIHIEGKIIQKKYSITGNIGYQHQYFHYYGYNPDALIQSDSIFQNYHKTSSNVLLSNDSDSSSFLNYNAKISLQNQTSREKNTENNINVALDLSKKINNSFTSKFSLSANWMQYSQFQITQRYWYNISPQVFYTKKKFFISAGINIAIQSDTINKQISVYPLITGKYKLHSLADIYTRIYGENNLTTWKNLTDINPYLSRTPSLIWNNNNKIFAWELEIQGHYNVFSYTVGYSFSSYSTYGFFVPSFKDSTQYSILYETKGFTSHNFFIKMDFLHTSGIKASFKGEYFIYNTSLVAKPFHLPEYKAELEVSYLFYNKIDVTLSAYFMGGIFGYSALKKEKEIKLLNPFADVAMNVQYLFSKKISAFLTCNNILNKDYQVLTNYPVRQFTLKIGAVYCF